MTITILKLDTDLGHKIPRPFNRASSVEEMHEIFEYYCKSNGWAFERCASGRQYYPEHLNTDHPILYVRGTTVKFYAYTEQR